MIFDPTDGQTHRTNISRFNLTSSHTWTSRSPSLAACRLYYHKRIKRKKKNASLQAKNRKCLKQMSLLWSSRILASQKDSTSSIKSWLGAPGRFFIATSIPSWSKPLNTSPNFPCPIKLLSLKLFVARDNSWISNRLASRRLDSIPAVLPTADHPSNWLMNTCLMKEALPLIDDTEYRIKLKMSTLNWWIRRPSLRSSWNAPSAKKAGPYDYNHNPHQCHGSCSTS